MYPIHFDLDKINELLPHRAPVSLLTEAIISSPEESISFFQISADADLLKGHFPDYPVVPATYLTEAMAQGAGLLLVSRPEFSGEIPLLIGISNMRFLAPIQSEQKVEIRAKLVTLTETGMADFCVAAYVGDVRVATGKLTLYSKAK